MRSLTLSLPAQPAAASLMRQRLRMWLEEIGVDDDLAIDLIIACSEAFANAVAHAVHPSCNSVDVEAQIDGNTVVVKVRDWGCSGSCRFAANRAITASL